METKVYTKDGKEAGNVTLPETIFNVAWNADLVHDVVVAMQSNARTGSAHTKDRSEVRGGGKKPWRQKGTGRARHGSRRSPIWVGGGIAHGPRNEKDYTKKINKNTRAKALASVLSRKHADGEVLFVDALSFEAPKSAEARKILTALSKVKGAETISSRGKNAALIVLPARNENAEQSFRNFGNVLVEQTKDINPVELLTYKYVVFTDPKATIEVLEHRVAKKNERAKDRVAAKTK